MRAAVDAVLVRDDADVGIQLEREALGIAAADVEMVEVAEPAHIGDGFLHAPAPPLVSDLLAGGIAEPLVVRRALAKPQMRDLEMRQEPAVQVQPGPEARTE